MNGLATLIWGRQDPFMKELEVSGLLKLERVPRTHSSRKG